MTARVHRVLTAVLGSLTGLSALLAATDTGALGLSDRGIAWIAVGLSAATVVVQAVRQAGGGG